MRYAEGVDPEAIRAFARRDRAAVAAAKRAWWAAQDPDVAVRAAGALWEHVRRLRPEWPTDRDRAEDLAHHVELKRRLDRAARAVPRR